MSKIIFLKKYYFNIFLNKKYFKPQDTLPDISQSVIHGWHIKSLLTRISQIIVIHGWQIKSLLTRISQIIFFFQTTHANDSVAIRNQFEEQIALSNPIDWRPSHVTNRYQFLPNDTIQSQNL